MPPSGALCIEERPGNPDPLPRFVHGAYMKVPTQIDRSRGSDTADVGADGRLSLKTEARYVGGRNRLQGGYAKVPISQLAANPNVAPVPWARVESEMQNWQRPESIER